MTAIGQEAPYLAPLCLSRRSEGGKVGRKTQNP
jgi:hypothetical protein